MQMKCWITHIAALCGIIAAANASDWPVNEGPGVPESVPVVRRPPLAAIESLGRALFFDARLSASGRLACASCHDPGHAFGPPDAQPVRRGGPSGRSIGQRAVPSLRYLQGVPVFTEHYFDEAVDESVDNGPTGGLTWDGRVQSPREQARLPLLSPLEMANPDPSSVVSRLAATPYADEIRRLFGRDILLDPVRAFDAITRSLEIFQQSPAAFYPYSSKYDEFLRHHTSLSVQERRGLELFNDPAKGNCARCHPSAIGGDGAFPAFTDFGYAAIAVPRNRGLPGNHDPRYFDLGLCGPLRLDLADRPEYCGMFRTPTLRNVAVRKVSTLR